MDDPVEAANWMKAERDKRGLSTTELADLARAIAVDEGDNIKLTQQSISTFEQGRAKKVPSWFRYVRSALGNGGAGERPDNVIEIWSRIPINRRKLATQVLRAFTEDVREG